MIPVRATAGKSLRRVAERSNGVSVKSFRRYSGAVFLLAVLTAALFPKSKNTIDDGLGEKYRNDKHCRSDQGSDIGTDKGNKTKGNVSKNYKDANGQA